MTALSIMYLQYGCMVGQLSTIPGLHRCRFQISSMRWIKIEIIDRLVDVEIHNKKLADLIRMLQTKRCSKYNNEKATKPSNIKYLSTYEPLARTILPNIKGIMNKTAKILKIHNIKTVFKTVYSFRSNPKTVIPQEGCTSHRVNDTTKYICRPSKLHNFSS